MMKKKKGYTEVDRINDNYWINDGFNIKVKIINSQIL